MKIGTHRDVVSCHTHRSASSVVFVREFSLQCFNNIFVPPHLAPSFAPCAFEAIFVIATIVLVCLCHMKDDLVQAVLWSANEFPNRVAARKVRMEARFARKIVLKETPLAAAVKWSSLSPCALNIRHDAPESYCIQSPRHIQKRSTCMLRTT